VVQKITTVPLPLLHYDSEIIALFSVCDLSICEHIYVILGVIFMCLWLLVNTRVVALLFFQL